MDTMTPAPLPSLTSAEDFAELSSMSKSAIYKMCRRKKNPMPHYRFGGSVRIDPVEGLAWARAEAEKDVGLGPMDRVAVLDIFDGVLDD